MSLKRLLRISLMLIFNLALIITLWSVGWKAILGFCAGVFIGSSVVLYWEYSRNTWLSYILGDVMKSKEDKNARSNSRNER